MRSSCWVLTVATGCESHSGCFRDQPQPPTVTRSLTSLSARPLCAWSRVAAFSPFLHLPPNLFQPCAAASPAPVSHTTADRQACWAGARRGRGTGSDRESPADHGAPLVLPRPSPFHVLCICRLLPAILRLASECNKPTWAGCGQHIETALAGVPEAERCQCPRDSSASGCTTQSQAAPQSAQ